MKPMELTKSMKSNKLANRVKGWSAIVCLAVALFNSACGLERPTCQFCGFNGQEQIQDLGTGGGFYAADNNGCVTIVNAGDGACSRFELQPLSGTRS